MDSNYAEAPEWEISRWFNTDDNPTLAQLRGEVVVVEAFQMLCPGCVACGIPQVQRIQQIFGDSVKVLGLHCVFEHHEAMTPVALEAFLHEYRITFPVGVDAYDASGRLPVTMGVYQLRGTPSLIGRDRAGRIRFARVRSRRRLGGWRNPGPPDRRAKPLMSRPSSRLRGEPNSIER